VRATFVQLHAKRGEFFERGVLAVFRGLSWDYKTNRPQAFGRRIVVKHVLDAWGSPDHHATDLWLAKTSSHAEPLTIRLGAWILAGSMLRLLVALLLTFRSPLRSRRDLVVETLSLRQQLATPVSRRHPVIRPADRIFWTLLRRLWSGWAESPAIVQPDTVRISSTMTPRRRPTSSGAMR
jgi:hypothetical protein